MKAIRVHQFGGLDSLVAEDVPRPSPGAGEVLLRVKAAGVGPWDALIRSGRSVVSQPLPLTRYSGPRIPGSLADTPSTQWRRLSTRVGDVLPLSDARMAHEMLAGKPHKPGKIVLEVESL